MNSVTFVVFVVPVSLAALSLIGLIAGIYVKRKDDREEAEEEEEAVHQLAANEAAESNLAVESPKVGLK